MQTYYFDACMYVKKRKKKKRDWRDFLLKKNNSYLDFDSQNKWDRTILNTPNV